jgi:hypothetical protein
VVGWLGGSSARKGIVPASHHLWRYQPRPPGFSGTRCHRTTDDRTYIGEITARNQGCLSFWAQVYVGGASGLIADRTAIRHCPIRNKSLRSFFRTSRRPCGFTIPRAAHGRVRTANTASSATAVQIFYSSHPGSRRCWRGSVSRSAMPMRTSHGVSRSVRPGRR